MMNTGLTGTTAPFTILNLPLPVVSQHVPPRNENENELCGEACAAAIVGYIRGTDVMPTAYEVAVKMNKMGLVTSGAELAAYLNAYFQIVGTFSTAKTSSDILYYVWKYAVAGKLLLALQTFSATNATPHWRNVVGMTETGVHLMEPWNGSIGKQTYADFVSLLLAPPSPTLFGVDTL